MRVLRAGSHPVLLRFTAPLICLAMILAACTGDDAPDDPDDPDDGATAAADAPDEGGDASASDADDTDEADAAEGPVEGGRLVVGVETEDPSLDTFVASITTAGRLISAAIFDTLVAYREDGTPSDFLAESVTSNEDGTAWSVELRPDVTFHDGTPFDAEALKYQMDIVREGAVYNVIDSVEVTGDLSLEFTISTPWVPFTDALASQRFYITSPTAVETYGVGEELGDNPVGTGPFMFQEWVRGSHLTVVKNPDYWYDGPYLDEIEFRFMPDEDSRVAALRAGDLDVAVFTGGGSAQFMNDDAFGVLLRPDGVNGIAMNMAEAPLDDLRVRQALGHAIDREALVQVVWTGVGDLNASPLPTDNPFHVDVAFPEHDPDEAARLIEEYTAETGNEVSLEISWPATAANLRLVQYLQAQWEAVGVEVEIPAPLQSAAFIQHAIAMDHQIMPFSHPNSFDPDLWMNNIWRSTSFLNFAQYQNERMDELLTIGKSSPDPAARQDAYAEMQQLVADDVPWLLLSDTVVGTVYADHVRGIGEWELPDGSLGRGHEARLPFQPTGVWTTRGQ